MTAATTTPAPAEQAAPARAETKQRATTREAPQQPEEERELRCTICGLRACWTR
ncbi:MAG TPA: hypothetical protein VGL99_08590 [Chloroflexota bacterium]|jgi:hypothetical protein